MPLRCQQVTERIIGRSHAQSFLKKPWCVQSAMYAMCACANPKPQLSGIASFFALTATDMRKLFLSYSDLPVSGTAHGCLHVNGAPIFVWA